MDYNNSSGFNPSGLLEALRLYKNPVYRDLAEAVGAENLFILSAGWGLVRSTFLLPVYDITFSSSAQPYTRRSKDATYLDFRHLNAAGGGDRILYFGGKSYIPVLCELTKGIGDAEKVLYFNSGTPPSQPGWPAERFSGKARTNWHYLCARAFIAGALEA